MHIVGIMDIEILITQNVISNIFHLHCSQITTQYSSLTSRYSHGSIPLLSDPDYGHPSL